MIIGVCGNRSGCGKDTVTNLLSQELNLVTADPALLLRRFGAMVFNEELELWENKEKFEKIQDEEYTRKDFLNSLYQWVREFDKTLFIRQFVKNYPFPMIFTSIRDPETADFIKSKNGIMVRVHRTDSCFLSNGLKVLPKRSLEDTLMDDYECDYTIINSGSLSMLHERTKVMAEKIRRRF